MKRETLAMEAYDDASHREEVMALWRTVFGYDAAHNDPGRAIDMKLQVRDGLFFVALVEDRVVGTAMAGYDGHRGWIYSIAVHPDCRRKGLGSALLQNAMEKLLDRGCMKVNLQILQENQSVKRFYEANGFSVEERVSMGKKLY